MEAGIFRSVCHTGCRAGRIQRRLWLNTSPLSSREGQKPKPPRRNRSASRKRLGQEVAVKPDAAETFWQRFLATPGVVDAGACSRFYRQKFLKRSGASSV